MKAPKTIWLQTGGTEDTELWTHSTERIPESNPACHLGQVRYIRADIHRETIKKLKAKI